MLKKIGIGFVILLGLLAVLFGFFTYSDDDVTVTISPTPTGGIVEADFLNRSEINGQEILSYPLTTTHGLAANQVIISLGTPLGNQGIFVKSKAEGLPFANDDTTMAILDNSDFHEGSIEVELNGSVSSNSSRLVKLFARGFIGICFHVSIDVASFECFYLRPENGPTDDPVRKNHAVQYISAPDFDFARLREEAPEKYENSANIAPGKWHKIRIEVVGEVARLFVDQSPNPILEVDDLKLGAGARGKIGLWVGPGTNGFFKNMVVTRSK